MELWNKTRKISEIEGVYESNRQEVILTFGQLTPRETIRFLEVILTSYVAVGFGDEFSIRDGDMIFPISIHNVIPLERGCIALVPIQK